MTLFTKQKQTHKHRKQLMITKGDRWKKDTFGIWDQQIHTTVYKTEKQQISIFTIF